MKIPLSLLCLLLLGIAVAVPRSEGYKNVSSDAQKNITKITTKILPPNSLCVKSAQCQSGKCLTNANESLYGYCQ